MSAARLVVALLIIRLVGAERYGEYALILSFLVIAEWVVDFGVLDIGVREVSRHPDRQQVLLRAVTILTSAQAVIAYASLAIVINVLGYSERMIKAGLLGGASLLIYASVVIYRVHFRTRMRIEEDVAAEVIGVLTLVSLVTAAGFAESTIEVFMGCYLLSRIVHASTVLYLGRKRYRLGVRGVTRTDLTSLLSQAVPLGIGGLLYTLNENMIAIVLSKFASLNSVAEYQYALRFVLPIVMVVQSLNVAFFPVLSRTWNSDRADFRATQQNAIEASVLVGSGLFCLVNAGAEFLLGLAGPDFVASSLVFRLMSCLVLLQVLTLPVTPLIVIAGGVHKVLWLTAILVTAQFLGLLWLVPTYGTLGAVTAYLGVKLIIGTAPIIVIAQRMTGVRLSWHIPAKTLACAIAALAISELVFGLGSLPVALFCAGTYCALLFVTGVLRVDRLRSLSRTLRHSSEPS